MSKPNIILLTDSYKISHFKQYPPGTEKVYSYFECRGGAYEQNVFFGLQYFLKKYLCGVVVTREMIEEADEMAKAHFGHPVWTDQNKGMFNREGWEHILNVHGGKLPISIKAVPEGTVVPYKNALFTMENTDPKCYWLTNYLETLLVEVWYPITVATQSREQKKIIAAGLKKTGTDPSPLMLFKLHDFGYRGVSSHESAGIGGAAHLVNFLGTDTMAALVLAKQYYAEPCAGFSIPASEHSTITSWTRAGEVDAMRNMLTAYPTGLVACVSDSFDIFNACEKYWGGELKDLILGRDGCLVVRPDSGELPGIVGDVLDSLGKVFETTTTSTGHKLLPPQIRVIQGDGISIGSLQTIIDHIAERGWALDNLAFGSGGALLQKLHRDTLKIAFKCCNATIKGEEVDIYKDPITDPGKKSKKGRLTLEKTADGSFTTVTEGKGDPAKDCLVEIFRDGELLVDHKFSDIRARCLVEGF
jgi:nicotinamide phosphoribosyltransferase